MFQHGVPLPQERTRSACREVPSASHGGTGHAVRKEDLRGNFCDFEEKIEDFDAILTFLTQL